MWSCLLRSLRLLQSLRLMRLLCDDAAVLCDDAAALPQLEHC
jgi:hypothetical protein